MIAIIARADAVCAQLGFRLKLGFELGSSGMEGTLLDSGPRLLLFLN